jgi:hypothetical protein
MGLKPMTFIFPVVFAGTFGLGAAQVTAWSPAKHDSCVLHKLMIRGGARCLLVEVSYAHSSRQRYDFIQSRFDNLRLFVTDRRLGYRNFSTVFEITSGGFTSPPLSTTRFPLYQDGYLTESCLLPTARLVEKDDGYYLVVFCERKGRLYFMNKNSDEGFHKVETYSPKERIMLTDLYVNSFDPSDVYWDYSLVTHARFFGYYCQSDSDKSGTDTRKLYRQWRSARPLPNEDEERTVESKERKVKSSGKKP